MQAVAIKVREIGRLISTTDIKLARKLEQFVTIDEITGGDPCKRTTTEAGTITFWHHGELFELGELYHAPMAQA